jgi:hypothetical protein
VTGLARVAAVPASAAVALAADPAVVVMTARLRAVAVAEGEALDARVV